MRNSSVQKNNETLYLSIFLFSADKYNNNWLREVAYN